MPKRPDPLQTYRRKRDLRRTPEPSGSGPDGRGRRRGAGHGSGRGPGRGRGGVEPIFVIQKHDATALHYDVRLEAGGVLKSWAVPRGPSTDPRDKRLAMPTEDHPLAYADFEGVIPEGHYGAGPVIVWDAGTYRNLTERDGRPVPVEKAVEAGHVVVWLEGTKLRGGYAFTRTGIGRGRDRREKWLLVKMKDGEADARRNPVATQPESVLSGRRIEDLAARDEAS